MDESSNNRNEVRGGVAHLIEGDDGDEARRTGGKWCRHMMSRALVV